MINSINYRRAMGMAVAIVLGPQAFGQVSFSNSAGLAYSQNFDGLSATGTPTWTDNNTAGLTSGSGGPGGTTSAGWYAAPSSTGTAPAGYLPDRGDLTTLGLRAYRSGSASTDLALGAYPGNSSPESSYYIGLQLRYTGVGTLPTLSQLQVIYRGEVWRDATSEATTMTFEYQVSASPISLTSGSWTAVSSLDYAYTGDGTTSREAGNGAGNFAQRNAVISGGGFSIADDNYIMLRWTIPNTAGADHAFAIDDVFIAVPEAGTWAAGALLGSAVVLGYRRSRRTVV